MHVRGGARPIAGNGQYLLFDTGQAGGYHQRQGADDEHHAVWHMFPEAYDKRIRPVRTRADRMDGVPCFRGDRQRQRAGGQLYDTVCGGRVHLVPKFGTDETEQSGNKAKQPADYGT